MNGARSYRISELLGRGSFGSVYLADTVGTGIRRPVAIKVLRPEQAAVPGLLERLRDEARMLSMIRHRAIVRVDDLVELDGHWSVVMEYVEGCDVAALLQDSPFPPRVALAIAEEVANALHVAATQAGPDGRPLRLVHRDIKPGNIRVTAQGEVKLLDFGVARADFSTRESVGTNAVFGTPIYMAPERYRGEDTHAGDVYALGVTLFEMLAGEPPGMSPMEPERVPPGIKLAPAWRQIRDTSLPLRDLVGAMMAADPSERPPARECARALARIRGQIGGMTLEDWSERIVPPALRARRRPEDGRVGTVLAERPSQASLAVQRRSGSTPTTRRSWAAWVAAAGGAAVVFGGLAALLVAGGAAWWLWGDGRGEGVDVQPAVEAPDANAAPALAPAPSSPEPANAAASPEPASAAASPEPPSAAASAEPANAASSPPDSPTAAPATASAVPAGGGAPVGGEGTAGAAASAVGGASAVVPVAAPSEPKGTPATASSEPATASSERAAQPAAGPAATKAPPREPPARASAAPTPARTPSTAAPGGAVTGGRAAPSTGIVALEGKAESVILMGKPGVFPAGEVPVGEYAAEVTLAEGEPYNMRDITVSPGRVTTIACDARYCREATE